MDVKARWIGRAKVVFLFLIVGILPLFSGFGGQAIGPWGNLHAMVPGGTPIKDQPWDVLQADGALQFYVWRDLSFESWSKHQVPFWNAYELNGTALLANSQSEALYPPSVLLALAGFSTQTGVLLLAWFHLTLCGLGSYWFARTMGARRIPACFAGLGFAVSPFIIAWTGLASVPATCGWLACYWAARQALAQQPSLARLSTAGICLGMMLLAGHLQFAAYGILFGELLALWTSIHRRTYLKAIPAGALAVALGVGLASPQFLPSYLFSKESHRKNQPTTEGYRAYLSGAIQPFEYGNLLFPTLNGNPRDSLSVGKDKTVQGYFPSLLKPNGNFAESACFLGPVLLAFLLLLPLKDRRWWGLGFVSLFALGLAFGSPLNALFYFGIPGWSSSGSLARVSVVFILGGWVLAALALSRPSQGRLRLASYTLGGLWLATLFFGLKGLGIPEEASGLLSQTFLGAAPFILLVAGLSTVGSLAVLGPKFKVPREALLAIPLSFALPYLFTLVPFGPLPPKVVAHQSERIAIVNSRWSLYETPLALMPPNLAALNRIHEVGGYDSLIDGRYVNRLKDTTGAETSPPENGNMMFVKPGPKSPTALESWGVSAIWVRQPDGSVGVQSMKGSRATANGKPQEIESEDFHGVTLKPVQGPAKVILNDFPLKGFYAEVDNKVVPLENPEELSVEVPAGEHKVSFKYVPPGYSTGLTAGLISLFVLALLQVFGRLATKPGSQNVQESDSSL